ncbi:MAG: type I DNA topoisomerase [Acidobacteria bacterium]|nr:MAG: type I DNA topoisomerase [Acidobacteriota bacterium]
MAKSLVIVESPAKAKTINKYLGADFTVKASMGHVKDLPKKELGVNLEKDFKPKYVSIPGKSKVIQELKSAAEKAQAVYLAADPDREGEAICQHLKELLNGKRRKFHRVLFNEITRDAVREAFAHPGEINDKLVDAQQARRILDRLVGYQVSPLLWERVKQGISAGRVQTVALRLIVEREREIQAFQKREYWTIEADLVAKNPPPFLAHLLSHQGKELGIPQQGFWGFPLDEEKEGKKSKELGVPLPSSSETSGKAWWFDYQGKDLEIPDQGSAEKHVARAKVAEFIVQSATTKEKRKFPVPPFTTSKLQQEAVRKLHQSAKKAMMLAQRLYEGVDIGEEGPVGLITYMRTDSVRVAEGALSAARGYIESSFGREYLPPEPIHYRSKKDAQDAHEAIRPTDVTRTPESVGRFLSPDELKMYQLIWRRFVASQMLPAVYDHTTIDITAGDYMFRATGSVLKFKGFLAVYEEGKDEKSEMAEDEELKHALPAVEQGEALKLRKLTPEQHFTEPPPRFNEATLVKALEEKGIGRPSTYASILSVIQNREYVDKQQGRFYPSELGMVVSDLLVKHFSDIFDVAYTARMEEELDEVEEGKLTWTKALAEFYQKFKKDLRLAERKMDDIKGEGIPTEEKCEKCGKPMNIRLGRNGAFLACTAYPDCDGTRDLPPELAEKYSPAKPPAPEVPEQACEKCGKPMAVKRGRFGYFLACTGYPDCRNTKRIVMRGGAATTVQDVPLEEKCPECGNHLVKKHGRFGEFTACSNYPTCKYIKRETLGIACPEKGCAGEIVVRRSKRGPFYGCTRYPECKFTSNHKPVAEPCPSCGAPVLFEKTTKTSGTVHYCRAENCKYERAVAPEAVASGK